MKQVVQLFIENNRMDLFNDESVTITQTIKNVRDIQKVFTSFSKTFSLPASKNNNKIFKHYYNSDISGGFDGRVKKSSRIEINNIPFKTGKIKLEGVDLKNNKAHTYRITFFGDIVDLKDKLSEKKLSDLDLNAYNIDYDYSNIYTRLGTDPSTNDIIVPLITHSQRLFYNSDPSAEVANDGNLKYYSGGGSHDHGVKWNQLKYAIRVNKIIEQIETDFGLTFSNDFFKNTSNDEFNNLFLWLHRKSGPVENLSGDVTFDTLVDGFTNDTTESEFQMVFGTSLFSTISTTDINSFQLQLTTSSSTSYDIRVEKDFNVFYEQKNISGSQTINLLNNYDTGLYQVFITSTAAITFSKIRWAAIWDISSSKTHDANFYTTNQTFRFIVNRQIPDMKIIDFLTGLFKVFNLIAFVEDGTIVVKTLDSYYATNTTPIDITEYVDVNTSVVDVALPFKEIDLNFKDTKSFLAQKFGELNNRKWGTTTYNNNETDLAGDVYKISAPFGHMLFERLTDVSTASSNEGQKDIQWGYSVDKSQNPYIGAPLLFYPELQILSTAHGPISFVNQLNEQGEAISHQSRSRINVPLNSVSTSSSTNDYQFNFNREISEWTGDTTYEDTLFQKYYKTYLTSVFKENQGLIKITAYLPIKIFHDLEMYNRLQIGSKVYKINSIKTNLINGKSDIELLNE